MTERELTHFLSEANFDQMEKLSEDASSSALFVTTCGILARQRFRYPFVLSGTAILLSFVATCFSGWGENYFSNAPVTAAPLEAMRQNFSVAKFTVGSLFLGIIPAILIPRWGLHRMSPLFINGGSLLVKLLQRSKKADLAMLLISLHKVHVVFEDRQMQEFDPAIAALLLHLEEEEAQALPEDARRWLRWRLEKTESPEFRVAALLTLASAGDAKLVPIVRALQHTADERVRMAASEALRIVETHG